MKLDDLQRAILVPQIDAFLAVAPDAAARAQYETLRTAISALEVPEALGERLGAIAEVLLNSGRVRDAYGPGAELALWALYQATPRGRAILTSVASVNAALKRLEGQTLEFVGTVARAPGVYSLTLKNADMQLILRFEPAGIRIESAELG